MTEQPNERCPCCDREIKWFRDYPLMQILSVSIIKPEEVPNVIKSEYHVEFLEKPRKKFFRKRKESIVPPEVISYFKSNNEREYAHSDGYVYRRYVSH